MFRNVVTSKRELVVSCAASIRVYSLATGEALRSFKAHDGSVTCTQLCPSNSTQLFTSSPADNLLKCWDFNDGKLLEISKLVLKGWNLLRFTVLKSGSCFGLVALNSKYLNAKNDWKVVQFRLQTNDTAVKTVAFGRVLLKSKGWKCAGLTSGGLEDKYVAAISNCTLLWFDSKLNESSKRVHSRELTALAIHPTQECIATGDIDGKIVLWRRNTCSILHWHAHPLSVTSFTRDGLYLLSGGQEAVLVIWQLGSSKKTFLPRLGAPITELCVNNDSSKYAVRTEQNVIKSIDAPSLTVDFELNGLAFKSLSNRAHCETLGVDPQTGGVIIPRDGTVHLYSAEDARVISSVDVCKRNYVSPTEDEKMNTNVVEAATATSMWLATVERRRSEVTLKLWERSSRGEFALVSVVSRAHQKRVNALHFHPSENALVTGSDDCYFKVWKLKSPRSGWFCQSVAFHKMLPIKDCKFSNDGSIIAVAEPCSVTLWDYKSNALLERLSTPQLNKGISRLTFCGQYSLVVMVRNHGLHVWDLRRLSIAWSLNLPVLSVATRSNTLAVATRKHVLVFSQESPVPTHRYELKDVPELLAYSPKTGGLLYRTKAGTVGFVSSQAASVQSKQMLAEEKAGILALATTGKTTKRPTDAFTTAAPASQSSQVLQSLSLYSSHLLPDVKSIYESMNRSVALEQTAPEAQAAHKKRKITSSSKNSTVARVKVRIAEGVQTSEADREGAKESLTAYFRGLFA